MTSRVFDPTTGLTNDLDELRDGKPFMRKILKNIPCPMQAIEIKISQTLLNNPHKNIVKIYEVKQPTIDCDGYIDSELLEPLLDENGRFTKSNIEHIDRLQEDLTDGLIHLHNNWIVYIDLHTGNVGWSKYYDCWKIFDFNMSGIVKENTNEWSHEPSRGIYYNAMLEQSYIFEYDNIALALFEREKNRLLKNNDISI